MGWIKEANKLGEYQYTFKGYRIYEILAPSHTEYTKQREGYIERGVVFHPGKYMAINGAGHIIERKYREHLILAIQIEGQIL